MRLLTVEDVAATLRVSKYHAYELIRSNRIRATRIGRLVRVREEHLEQFLGMHDVKRNGRQRQHV